MHHCLIKQAIPAIVLVLAGMLPQVVFAVPGDILFSDDFNRAALAPWTTTDATRSGILTGGQTSGSNPRAGFTRNNSVTVTSPAIDAAVPAARFEIWVRRGSDALNGSEDPDVGEDFVIEYQTVGGTWNPIVTYLGAGTNGQIIQASFVLPAAALHNALALRVRQTLGSGFDFDYWHFDDVVVTEIALGGPLTVGNCDEFEAGLGANWTINSGGGLAGISGATFLSPSNSLFLNGGVVDVTSNAIDTTDITFSDVSLWIRRGSDQFSEDPDGGEDLVIEYFDDVANWVTLETFAGSGGPGQILNRVYPMPAASRHTGFRLRFRMTGGSGTVWDFWHIDDVCLDQDPDPILQVTKVANTLSDPVNMSSGPLPIPGAIVEYTITVANQGIGTVDASSLVITDPLPPNTALYVETAGGIFPITFTDGTPPSGLSYNFAADVTFSNQVGGGAPYNYIPVPDGQGFDPAVTGYRIAPTGAMNGDTGSGTPNFDVVFQVRIE